MYKLFTQAQYDDNGTHRHLVNAVYTDDKQHPRLPTCEGAYDQETPQSGHVKWWQCSTDELCDDREYKSFLLCQEVEEVLDGSNSRITFVPDKRNIVFNKKGDIVLLCNDAEWCRIMKSYGSIENCLEARI